MTNIYFVRHGEVYNPKRVWYGRLPRYRLSLDGINQVRSEAKRLKEQIRSIDRIYTSPLLRARQTASVFAEIFDLDKISNSSLLLEVRSHFEGRPFERVKEVEGNIFADNERVAADETMRDVLQRMVCFCQQMVRRYPQQSILAASHGDPLMILKAYCEGKPMVINSIRPGADKYLKYAETYKVEANSEFGFNLRRAFLSG